MARLTRILLLASLLLISSAHAQDETQDLVLIRAIWTADVFVVINTSDTSVDLSNLLFRGLLGEIAPSDWQMATDPETNAQYTLVNVAPGSCLVAHFGVSMPNVPNTIRCSRTIGRFTVTTTDDLIWSVAQGGFTPFVGDNDYTQCSIRVSSCDLPVLRAREDAPETMIIEPETIDVRAIWTPDIFVVINTSGIIADVSDLRFESALGKINPDDWVMDFAQDLNSFYTLEEMRPGSCLVAQFGANLPSLPATIQCTRIMGRFSVSDVDNLIWSVTQGGFTPYLGETALESCSIERSSCDIALPNPAFAATHGAIQARWDENMLVLLNTSDSTLDVSTLQLVGENGFIAPDDWIIEDGFSLAEMRAGACLFAYVETDETPELPADIECTAVIGTYAIDSAENMVWSSEQDEFVPFWGDTPTAACPSEAGSCEIAAPAQP